MINEIINKISKFLVDKNETIATAESVTAGLLQNRLSLAPNASCFFEGGITVYNLEQKCSLLNVDKHEAAKSNCVSQLVADQMAARVTALFNSGYGMAITGYAAPIPEKNIDDLHAFYALTYRGNIFARGCLYSTKEEPFLAQQDYVQQLLAAFHQNLH